ncbi:unnamed protein product [Musa acuminata subsp. burmannicoides]
MKKVTNEVGYQNIIQIIELKHNFSNIIWILYVVHTLNLALKDIYIIMNIEQNQLTYNACSWISDIASDITMIKSLNLSKVCFSLWLLATNGIFYRDDDIGKAKSVTFGIDYILDFTRFTYDILRFYDTNNPYFHLVYDMWDSMIEKVKEKNIHMKERNQTNIYLSMIDLEASQERLKCLRRYYSTIEERILINEEYANFSYRVRYFIDYDRLHDSYHMDPKSW